MSIATLAPNVPREIRRVLGRVAGRLRSVQALRGLGATAVVAAVGAAVGMFADVLWALPIAVRWGIWAAWLILTTGSALLGIVRPLVRRLDPVDLAALAERGQPDAGERLVGAVALLSEGARARGSRGLVEALAGQAAEGAGAVDAGRAVPMGKAARWLAAGALAGAVVGLPPLLRPDPFGTMARRFLAPWGGGERVGRILLRVAPGDKVVPVGADLAVNARVSSRLGIGPTPGLAWLEWDDPETRSPRRLRMAASPAGPGTTRLFEARIPRVVKSLRYRVTAGDAASPRYEVTAVAPPALTSLVVTVEPPSYTKLPSSKVKDPARVEAVEGSTILFNLVADRPVGAIEVIWPEFAGTDGAARPLPVTPGPDGRSATARGVAEAAGSYRFSTRIRGDAHGLDGPEESRRLVVRADASPTLSVRPVEARESGPDDVLAMPVSARDDFAVASAELHYAIRRAGSEGEPESGKVELTLDGLNSPRASGEATLGLKPLGLNPGDTVSTRVRVVDNRPAPKGPNEAWSDGATLTIVAKAEPMIARRDRLRRERVAERLEEIKAANAATRRDTGGLRYAADAARRSPAAWDKEKDAALAGRESASRKAVDDLTALARDLEADPSFAPLAGPTRQVAEVEADAARAALAEAGKAPDPERRLASLRGADARLGAVHARVEDLQRRLDALAKRDLDRQRLRELAAREDALAAQAREAGDDRSRLDAIGAEQDAVRKELDALAAKSPELRAGLIEAQAEEAAGLAEQARALAARQRAEARKTAEEGAAGPRLEALADEQAKIEADARRLALDVDEPLAEHGRGRLNPNPIRDALAPIARGEVAPARQKLDEAEAELRRLARDLEDAPADPRALARRLADRQGMLAGRVAEAVREAKGKDNPDPKDREALGRAIKPLLAEQEAIAKLAEALKVDEPRKGQARDATQAVGRALDNLRNPRPRESESRQNEARQALNRLAEALPDQWKRDEPARQKLEEARRMAEEATRDLDKHLRETAPQPGRPHDPARAAADLADRLAPMARRLTEAADRVGSMDVHPRVEPQRHRAERRARALSALMDGLKKDAAALPKTPTGLVPIKEWALLGPLKKDQGPPFPLAKAGDPSARIKDKAGKPAAWKPAKAVDDRGRVDLRALYPDSNESGAFGSAEVVRQEAGTARFAIGSDDTFLVWVNGKQVFKFDGNRAYSPEQDSFEVPLLKGVNRVVVRCGNGSNEWGFGVEVAAPQAVSPALARVETTRRALPQSAKEARAGIDRLSQKLHGQQLPADDAAAELAGEAAAAVKSAGKADPDARRALADDHRRLATALRNLQIPDAPTLQAEAVRQAEAVAKALDEPNAIADAGKSASATKALADRLNDALAPVEAAVRDRPTRERALPDAPIDPDAAPLAPRAAEARDLARRERKVREGLQSILGGRVAPQEALRDESVALGKAFAGLRDRSREASPRSHGPANNAAEILTHQAPPAMARGAEELAQGRPDAARDTQRRAAETVERAAQAAEDLVAALKSDLPADAPPADLRPARDALAEAGKHLADEPHRPGDGQGPETGPGREHGQAPSPGQSAAKAMQRAAQAMRTAARPASLSKPGPPGGAPGMASEGPTLDPRGGPAGTAPADLAQLQAMVRRESGRTWGELPGHLRTEILQLSRGKYRDDYARLIQLYFKEIAVDAAPKDGAK